MQACTRSFIYITVFLISSPSGLSSYCQDSQVSVRTLKFACQDSQVCVRTAPSGRFRRGRARSKGGLGVYHSLLGGRGRRVAVKEGGGLVGGTCEHCEDRAPSGPRQDSVRTLSGLCQDSVRTVRTDVAGPQTRLRCAVSSFLQASGSPKKVPTALKQSTRPVGLFV